MSKKLSSYLRLFVTEYAHNSLVNEISKYSVQRKTVTFLPKNFNKLNIFDDDNENWMSELMLLLDSLLPIESMNNKNRNEHEI